MSKTRQIIPALPGYFALFPEKDGATISIFKEPIIAWAFDTSNESRIVETQIKGEKSSYREDYFFTGITPIIPDLWVIENEMKYIEDPLGHVTSSSEKWETVDDFVLHLEGEEFRRKGNG